MRVSNRQIRKRLGVERTVFYTGDNLQETIEKSTAAFVQGEAEAVTSQAEFLYQQSRYIHKRWWILQGLVLFLLWVVLEWTESSFYIQRGMGVVASLFAVLLLPELWKNRNANALEIESASFYSLRQIYAARIFAFALVDFLLLGAFVSAVVFTGRLSVEVMVIHFFLPYLVNCCICFRVLFDGRNGSQTLALCLCAFWCMAWTQIVLHEKVYEMISRPMWFIMTTVAVLYLVYCINKGKNSCAKMWEVNKVWN